MLVAPARPLTTHADEAAHMAEPNLSDSEEWRIIPGFPNYEASNHARVRNKRTLGIIKPNNSPNGYLYVSVRIGAKRIRKPVHQFVCLAFHGERPSPTYEVAHNDGSKNNNMPSNLRWATRSDNFADEILHGTKRRGSVFGWSKLTENDVLEIRELLPRMTLKAIADRYGVCFQTISDIKRRRNWGWLK